MARKLSSLGEVNDTKETWKLPVRITDLWSVQTKKSNNLEIVFIDEKGDKIHAIVQNLELDKWKTQLQEGKTYIVQNFEVQFNEGQYQITNHRYKLVLTKATIVKEHDLPAIPAYLYHFSKLGDIISGHASPDVLVDIIAEFEELKQCQTNNSPKKVVFKVKDESSVTQIEVNSL